MNSFYSLHVHPVSTEKANEGFFCNGYSARLSAFDRSTQLISRQAFGRDSKRVPPAARHESVPACHCSSSENGLTRNPRWGTTFPQTPPLRGTCSSSPLILGPSGTKSDT